VVRGSLRVALTSWALCAGCACAQPAVEVFGAVDVAVARLHGGGRPTQWRIDSGGLGATSLGLRARESLSPSLQLAVVLEHGFDADTGRVADAARNSFNRQAWIGLATPHGEFRFGRQASPQHELMTRFDIFAGHPFGSALANTSALTERFDNLASWRSPEWRHLRGHVGFAPGEQPRPVEYGKNRYIIGVEYLRGPWHAALVAVQQNSANTELKTKTGLGGVSRAVGSGRLYAVVMRSDDNGADVERNIEGVYYTTWSLSIDQRWRERWTFGALVGGAVAARPARDDARQLSLLARYQLSPRTALYAIAARLNNQRGARFALGGATAEAPLVAGAVSGLQLGMRHLF
jgi:predicted porin